MSDINIDAIADSLNNKVDLPSVATSQDDIDFVIEWQKATADNDYTWYRKYKSGWVEQGGCCDGTIDHRTNPITIPMPMSNAKYTITAQTFSLEGAATIETQSDVGFTIFERVWVNEWYYHNFKGYWQVSGMAA